VLIAESPDGNYSRRKNAGLMPGRGATSGLPVIGGGLPRLEFSHGVLWCFIYSGKWIESVLNSRKQNALGTDTQNNKEDEEQEVHAARR